MLIINNGITILVYYDSTICICRTFSIEYLSTQSVWQLKTSHFKLILAIEEFGQLSTAANALATTQPAASRMLGDIERILEAPLCIRQPKGMTLTVIGKVVARRARQLLSEMNNMARDVEELKSGRGGTVKVGAVTSAAVSFVVPAIQQLKAAFPAVDVYLDVAPSDVLVRDLLGGQHDFILGRIPSGLAPELFEIQAGRIEEVAIMVREDHPLSKTATITLADLCNYDWVAQDRGSPIRDAIDAAFFAARTTLPSRVTNTSSLLATLSILTNSTAVAPIARVVFDMLSSQEVATRVRRLVVKEVINIEPYNMMTTAGQTLSPTAGRLQQLVLAELAKQPSTTPYCA